MSFRKLREEERLFDVTLATDNGHQIQAHKMVLSSGSNFVNDIFLKSNHTNMLIYLKGISSGELEQIADFLYNGETSCTQEELNKFLETGQELQVKGLQGNIHGIGQHLAEEKTPNTQVGNYNEEETECEIKDEIC